MLYYKTIENSEHNDWVVMIHGAGASMEVWYRQVPDFARHFNLLLVDLAGCGGSKDEAFGENFDFINAAEQVLEVVDYLKIRKCHFMGVSLATIIVRLIAEQNPERVKSMVLAGAVTEITGSAKWILRCTKMAKNILPYSLIKRCIGLVINPRGKYTDAENVFLRTVADLSFASFLIWLKLADGLDARAKALFRRYAAIPALYIMGEEDFLFLRSVERSFIYYGNYASLVVVPHAGHVCNIDNKKFFNQQTLAFLCNL